MRDRISQIIQHEKLTNAEFAEKIGVLPPRCHTFWVVETILAWKW